MNKYTRFKMVGAIVGLMFSILACTASASYKATQTALVATSTAAAWTKTPTFTPTPDFNGLPGLSGANMYSGPGEVYLMTGFIYDKVTIIGQAYDCEWFKVVAKNDIGWVRADKITYSVKCSDVVQADIPATPVPTATKTPLPTATRTARPIVYPTKAPAAPAAPAVGCMVVSNIRIDNRTEGSASLSLTGPGKFFFVLPLGANTVKVCAGSYNYFITGTCNGVSASGSGRISDGDDIYFHCN